MRDIIKESPDYVRGVLSDSIEAKNSNRFYCDMCGTPIDNNIGCHYQCKGCGNQVGCGD